MSQLLNALSGEARDMVSALPAGSFDKAMEQQTTKFGDSFLLAASYIPATEGEAGTTKKQKFRAAAAAAMVGNLELVLPELEAQDITACKRLLCDPPGALKSSRTSTTGLASSQCAEASQPQRGAPNHPIQAWNGGDGC